MIAIGAFDDKKEIIKEFALRKNLSKVLVVSRFPDEWKDSGYKVILFDDVIMYKVFYPLLAEVNNEYLLVVDECLKYQDKSHLTYNCLFHVLRLSGDVLIFQYNPIIQQKEDYNILNKLNSFSKSKEKIIKGKFTPGLKDKRIFATEKELSEYNKQKENQFSIIGNRDPDIIPRYLHLWASSIRKRGVEPFKNYIGRGNKQKISNFVTYDSVKNNNVVIFDFPCYHNDFWLAIRDKEDKVEVITSNLPVDLFYFNQYSKIIEEANGIFTSIQ